MKDRLKRTIKKGDVVYCVDKPENPNKYGIVDSLNPKTDKVGVYWFQESTKKKGGNLNKFFSMVYYHKLIILSTDELDFNREEDL